MGKVVKTRLNAKFPTLDRTIIDEIKVWLMWTLLSCGAK